MALLYLQQWRECINTFITTKMSEYTLPIQDPSILEIGPEGNIGAVIDSMFTTHKRLDYGRTDLQIDYNADICNINALQGFDLENKFDAVVCLEVLEHTTKPWVAAENLTKLLKPGGVLYISVPSFLGWHPHGYGWYPDNWRFLPGHVINLFPNLKEEFSYVFTVNDVMIGMTYALRKI